MKKQHLLTGLFVGLIAWSGTSTAALLSATATISPIQVGNTAMVDIFLDLQGGELASGFEGRFGLVGLGTVADVGLIPGGTTWASSFGNVDLVEDLAIVSLTSGNAGGSRLVGRLDITALAPGTFQVVLESPTFATRDLDIAPFFQDVPIGTAENTVLASVSVTPIPLPAALPLFSSALGLMGFIGWRRKQAA